MKSGELARLTGVSTDTLRHYERLGLLKRPVRTQGNYREYEPAARQRVELIQRALKIGFALRELKEIFAQRDSGSPPCRRVRDLLGAKMRQVDEQLRNLAALRTDLKQLRKQWDARLRRTKPGQAARLLESMGPRPSVKATRREFRTFKSPEGG
jgi:DNA-binding transcriptional MerR regulator